MRSRSDKRREAIVRAASEVFHELGFARASMAVISARLGGSKGTLYAYFKSKEELFTAVMRSHIEGQAARMVSFLRHEDDIFAMFVNFGEAYLDLLASDYGLSTMRTVIAESNSSLGAMLYAEGPEQAWAEISETIAGLARQGRLQVKEPRVAAMHLKGLLEAGIIEPLLFGAKPMFERREAIMDAVEIFLKVYGVWSGRMAAARPAPSTEDARPAGQSRRKTKAA